MRATDVGAASGRGTARWGLAFVVLLLVSAGMVTVPGGDDSVAFVRDFYGDHGVVVLVAQLIGLAAAGAFVPFARGLQARPWVGRDPWVVVSGASVAGAAVVVAVPPLALCLVADSGSADAVSGWATASDLTDVVLFLVIAGFAAVIALAVDLVWLRVLAGVVALANVGHAVLMISGRTPLELAAAMAFLVLVVCLSVCCRRR